MFDSLIPLVWILLPLDKLILILIWHSTHINRECSGLKCFRLTGSNFLFEIELENEVTVVILVVEEPVVVGLGRGCHVDTGASGSSERATYIHLFYRLLICHLLLITDF